MEVQETPGVGPHAMLGGGAAIAVGVLNIAGVTAPWPYFTLSGAVFTALGGLCLLNYARCRAIHCAMSGPPYVVLGVAALLTAAGMLALSMPMVWGTFAAIVVASFSVEAVYVRFAGAPKA